MRQMSSRHLVAPRNDCRKSSGRYLWRASTSLLLCLLVNDRAGAQVETARAVIAGQLRSSADSSFIADAEVYIVGSQHRRMTDAAGAFRFSGIVPGQYEVRARRVGYEQLVRMVTVGPGELSYNRWEMRFLPQQLAEVRVQGRLVHVSPFHKDAYRRAAWGFGDFLLPEDISRRDAYQTSDLLEMIPGARVSRGNVEFARCSPSLDPFLGTSGSRDKVQVYIDGQLVTRTMSVAEALTLITPRDIEIIEVYRGVARIPAEFLADACAVIAIWTKRG